MLGSAYKDHGPACPGATSLANVNIAAAFLELKQHKVSIASQVWARGLGQGLKSSVSKQYAAHFTLFPAAYTISNPYFKIRNSQSLNT